MDQKTVQKTELIISRATIQAILEVQEGFCITIYLPTHQAGPDTEQNPIRLQNLLRDAESQLRSRGLRKPEAAALLEPGRKLVQDQEFWEHQHAGLALFLSDTAFQFYCLPLSFEERVSVGERFYCKPLLPLLSGDGLFYVLALSQQTRHLYECSRYSVRELVLEGIPHNLKQTLPNEDHEEQLQFHTGAPNADNRRAAMFHGQGAGDNDTTERIVQYFQQVEAGVFEVLKDQHAPLLLAAVDHYHYLFHEINRYPHLMKEGITKNAEELSPDEIQEQAWPLVHPLFEQAIIAAKARYQDLVGTGQTSNQISDIALAAVHGRLDVLFVIASAEEWGVVDLVHNTVEISQNKKAESQELLDFSAIHTLTKGGSIYALSQEDMPKDCTAAAIFRY
ncbi:baeRF7 domain-containing protein [Candidatus Nitrospira salsa]